MKFMSYIIFIIFFTSIAYAHKVNIYAYAEDGMVYSESYFSDGKKCKNSIIKVFDANTGEKLLEGKTDKDGKFSFKIPKITSLKLILCASMGHQDEYILNEDEIKAAIKSEKALKSKIKKDNNVQSSKSITIDSSELEAVIEKVIERKLQPIISTLLKIQRAEEKPGVTEILGGIGYIIGLMGLAMYYKSKKILKK